MKKSYLKYRKRFKVLRLRPEHYEKTFDVYPADDFRLSLGFYSHGFYHVKVIVSSFKPF